MPLILLLKLLLVPSLIYAVTLVGRRWGPGVAGWMSAFPIVSGPILLTVTLEQGAAFAARAAEGTLLAVIAVLVFSIAYAWTAERFGMAVSMLGALLAWALAVAGLQAVQLPVAACFAMVVGALLIAPKLFPRVRPDGSDQALASARPVAGAAPASDLPWRMLAGAALVLAVSYGAAAIGARLSGFFAMFPVMSTVLVGFSHVRSGRAFAVALLRGMVFGYFAFATFCLVLSLLLREGSAAAAFGAAFAGALAVQLAVKRLMAKPAVSAGAPLARPAAGKSRS
ncbi:hypothetical protein ASD15_27355 [Massilia sp. Root351]|jgi:hypothetical protein|uniref:hypothetical protein n=1 Tax=Massilia sp. Root351 TaxID=1736522 RepID=UPI00070DC7A0|nr:hypothetical protein [Massilia sp. Root351]KQV87779.1 hypothetical protein ASD15_27355 [Massilia sp. Root351]